MLLTIDIGNTNVVWGLFEDSTLRGHWRLATESRRTDNEYGILLLNLLNNCKSVTFLTYIEPAHNGFAI